MTRTCLAASLLALSVFTTPAHAQQSTGNFNDTYGVLSERNMFLRERHRPRTRSEIEAGRRSRDTTDWHDPAVVERTLVLRGVAIEDDELHAYLENTHTGEVLRVAPGDAIASGRVSDIAIDAIAYSVNDHPVWVDIGQNLAGARVTDLPPTTAPANTGTTDPTKPAPLPPGGGSLEERMKARRAQQLQNHK